MDDYFTGSAKPAQASINPPPNPFAQPPAVSQHFSAPSGPPPQQWSTPPPSKSLLVKVLIGVAIGFGVLVVAAILVAIAIPVFLDQTHKKEAARTTVGIPATIAGLSLRTDAASDQMAQRLRVINGPGTHLAGAFGGRATPEVLVGITKSYMKPKDQRDYLNGAEGSTQRASAGQVSFGSVDPGALGGWADCASSPTQTICYFVDSGAYGALIVFGTPERAMQLLPEFRAAVEQHH